MSHVRNDLFNPTRGLIRGRSKLIEACWYCVKCCFFLSLVPWPRRVKVALLRAFGAKVGNGVYLKPRVNIHFPWKLEIGDHAWIGEEVFILNFEQVKIGNQCCISQRAFLCTGNHDFRDARMAYRNSPITIRDGGWVGAQVFVGPGVIIGTDAVVIAGSVVLKDVPDGVIAGGNPCVLRGERWKASAGSSGQRSPET